MRLKPQVGDVVTCKIAVECSSYTDNYYRYLKQQRGWKLLFEPGMHGVVVSIAAKVRIVRYDARNDGKDTFLVIDFETERGVERVGLNWCNTVVVQRGKTPC